VPHAHWMRFYNDMQRAHRWVCDRFGTAAANNRRERADRVLEEALELHQHAYREEQEVGECKSLALVQRVYSREVGERAQEMAGLMHTLMVFAFVTKVDLQKEVRKEMERIEALPKEHFQRKMREKFEAGVGMEPRASL
jgi:hypothetical protein